MANPFDIFREMQVVLKIANALAQLKELSKKGAPMSKYLPIILTVVATVSAAVGFPGLVAVHPLAFAVVAAVAQVLHAVLPGVFSAPSQS